MEKRPISDDERVIKSWLRGRPELTSRAYRRDVGNFAASVGKPLEDVTLEDAQDWWASVEGAPSYRNRKLAAVKSFYRFAVENRFFSGNPFLAVKADKTRDELEQRIITEADVLRMIDLEKNTRKRTALRFLYLTGVRVSEMCAITWRDMARKKQGGVVTVFGKGGKSRTITVVASLWRDVEEIRTDKRADAPVIPGHDGKPIDEQAVRRIVASAAKRAKISAGVTPHWLRHACISHALDNGAHIHDMQTQLGHASLATTTRYTHAREGAAAANYLKG